MKRKPFETGESGLLLLGFMLLRANAIYLYSRKGR